MLLLRWNTEWLATGWRPLAGACALVSPLYSPHTSQRTRICGGCYQKLRRFIESGEFITVTHERHGVLNHRQLDCLFNSSIKLTTKKTKRSITGPCEGNTSMTNEFPSQRVINAENCSMQWRQHGETRWNCNNWTPDDVHIQSHVPTHENTFCDFYLYCLACIISQNGDGTGRRKPPFW